MKIDGKQIAENILKKLKGEIQTLKDNGITPKLAIILVGEDPASVAYVRRKEIKAKEIGIETIIKSFPSEVPQKDLLTTIQQLSNNKSVHAIIVQQPLPKHINAQQIINAIPTNKDVDGFLKNSKFETPIANAVMEILKNIYSKGPLIDYLKSKKIIVIGKGKTGGQPIINMFRKMGIEPSVIDSKTKNPQSLTKKADIIISAVGKQNTIKENMLKKGIILISVGMSKGNDGKMHGDYGESEIKNKALFYTPTPGGVGPVNIAMLLKNSLTACKKLSH